jgi:hypothetical protein
MNFLEAVEQIKQGKKVRRPTFNKYNYLYFEHHNLMNAISKSPAYLVENSFDATDWEVVEDNKPLSDKYHNAIGDRSTIEYYENDVKEALKEFLSILFKTTIGLWPISK